MNIVGENFPEEIVKQINVRQAKKGAKTRDNQNLVWQNANTGWVKMVSSVDINKTNRLKVSNTEMAETILPGNQLAEQYVLFGGVYQQGKNKDGLSKGIARDGSVLNHASYGLGGLDLGIRPMPGITSFSIKSENRGSLKTATIGIKCYNRQQFDIINTLYLSLGYSVLIEWGNAMYYDNNKKFEENNPYSLADEFLHTTKTGNLKWNSILEVMRKKRLESCGNYDASLGKVVNFRWTLNRDLSYDVTVTVRSVGDVIESLKMNALSGYINVNLTEQQLLSLSTQNGGAITNPINDIPDRIAAWTKIERLAAAAGSSDPKITAAIAMNESGWLSSSYYKNGNNIFGQTILPSQIGTNGIVGRIDVNVSRKYIFAKYDSLESAVKHHLKKWQQYYVPGNIEQTTYALVQAGYNTVDAPWAKVINTIYNKRKNLSSIPPTNAQTSQPSVAVPLNPQNFNAVLNTITGGATTPETSNLQSVSPPLPSDDTNIKIISKYAYTHDIGALFYNMMLKLNDNPSFNPTGTSVDAVKIEFNNNGATTPQYYVRLGYFLQELEKNIIYQLKGSDKKNPAKIIKFDYDTDSNIILLYSRQLSANPNACIFKRKFLLSDDIDTTLFPELNDFILEGSGSTYSSFYGKIMNTYFSMSYILEQMNNLKNADTGVLALIDLLKILTRCFCDSTGNYNKIEPTVDEETNTIKFIDDVKLPDFNEIIKKLPSNQSNTTAEFRMFGYYATPNPNVSTAGIVRDLSLTTTVPPNLTTMITIGAQANGYVTGQDSTALSVMNYGLKDRVKEEWVEPNNPNNYPSPSSTAFLSPLQPQTQTPFINFITGVPQQTTPNQPTEQAAPTLDIKYKDVISSFNRFIQEMSQNTWNQGDVNAFSNSIQSFAEYNQAEETLKQRQSDPLASSPNIGFLPFDLTLTIDGLSGMKIYQKFVADTEFLPSNYPQSLEFLIKGITHEIKDNQWVTTLESLAVPKNPFGTKDAFNVGAKTNGQSSPTERAAGAGGSRPTNFTTNANYPNVKFQNIGYGNPSGDRINTNLLADISKAAQQVGITVSITTAVSGHAEKTKSGNPSRHGLGYAVDIAVINNKAVNSNSNFNDADKFVSELRKMGYVLNIESTYSAQPKAILWKTKGHFNHVHVSNVT
jgi:hypothetical protein